jgi:signal transduction histidine kinase
VLLDVNLPDASGYDVVRALRADPSGAGAGVIHTSAHHVDADRRVEGLEAGADAYLAQPIDPRELVAVARTLPRARRAEQQARTAYQAEHAARLEAQAANRAKSEFLAVMSHELRTPLNAIGGYTDLMALGIRGPVTADQREDVARIQKAQQHLLGLINAVLNYALADLDACGAPGAVEALVAPQLRAKSLVLPRA